MKTGEFIYAKTHAEFLNTLLGTNYKAWMKSTMPLPDGKNIWMIELGRYESTSGWINKLESPDEFTETHCHDEFTTHHTYVYAIQNYIPLGANYVDRAIFEIVKFANKRKYIFRGVFRISKEKSTIKQNVWNMISDNYYF